MTDTTAASDKGGRGNLLARYAARFDDGELAKWAFRGLLIGAIAVLALDVRALLEERAAAAVAAPGQTVYLEPALRTVDPALPGMPGTEAPAELDIDEAALRRPISFELLAGGVLMAEGSIDVGAADRLAAEIEARGEYVDTVHLNSPGGSLDDAMAMARLVREAGYSTVVPEGALCASSCPLFLAGGVSRRVADDAAIGLHQFYAIANAPSEPAQAMADAQATTARISRHLSDMGVDPAMWLHALDTPPQSLYYLSSEELARYRLVTDSGQVAARQ